MHWLPVILILPYFALFIIIYRNLAKIRPFTGSSDPAGSISVVVACRNEENNLQLLLDCLAAQNYPKDLYEVIIVDDNSTDKTLDKALSAALPGKITVLKNSGSGKKQALRTGINASSGDLIITTDADCSFGESWIRTIASFYKKNKPEMVVCPVALKSRPGFFGRFQELEFLSLQGFTAGSVIAKSPVMCNGANLAFAREAYFKHMDKLRPALGTGDDIFLLHSIKNEGGSKIMWLESQEAVVVTASSSTLSSFLRQRRRWISKWNAYTDRFTILTGIITFFTTLLQTSLFIAAIINPAFIPVFLTMFILKSVPDFLILRNTAGRYGKRHLMRWFIPAQLLYPVYVLSVASGGLFPAKRN